MAGIKYLLTFLLTAGAILFGFLMGGCTKDREPSQLDGLDRFSSENQTRILRAIDEFNENAGRILVSTKSNGYPIVIKMVSPERAISQGHAWTELNECRIEISSEVFLINQPDYLDSILWHEIGHCLGLGHEDLENELMYQESRPLSAYSTGSIERFFKRLLSSVNIH